VIIKQTSESLKKADTGEQIYAALVVWAYIQEVPSFKPC
jgi:hypothetical protein